MLGSESKLQSSLPTCWSASIAPEPQALSPHIDGDWDRAPQLASSQKERRRSDRLQAAMVLLLMVAFFCSCTAIAVTTIVIARHAAGWIKLPVSADIRYWQQHG